MIVTKLWIEKNYNKFNKIYWGGKLPNIEFKISRSKNTWGFATYRIDYKNSTIVPESLTMSNYYDAPEKIKLNTLLHEMIHIADYTFNPHHFIKYGRKVTGHVYDAHGYWFKKEAERINKDGYIIEKNVTKEEFENAKLSAKSKIAEKNKIKDALICVIYGENCNFMLKTDIHKVNNVKKAIKEYRFYRIGKILSVKFYKFNNEEYAVRRSCSNRLLGNFIMQPSLDTFLKRVNAKEVNF